MVEELKWEDIVMASENVCYYFMNYEQMMAAIHKHKVMSDEEKKELRELRKQLREEKKRCKER